MDREAADRTRRSVYARTTENHFFHLAQTCSSHWDDSHAFENVLGISSKLLPRGGSRKVGMSLSRHWGQYANVC